MIIIVDSVTALCEQTDGANQTRGPSK